MTESTPKITSEKLRMALRLRLSLRRAGNGRQSEVVFISTKPAMLRSTASKASE